MKRPLTTALWLYGVVVFFFILSVAPVLSVLAQGVFPPSRPLLSPFVEVFRTRHVTLLARTLALAAGTTATACLIGLPVGFLLWRADVPWRRGLRLLSFVPLVLPPYVSAVAWIYLFGSHGVANAAAAKAFGLSRPIASIQGLPGGIWCLGLSFWPIVALVSGVA
ncbi:MAG: hypothetical protein ACE5O2_10705, partial [Armatimonadota bacterium]